METKTNTYIDMGYTLPSTDSLEIQVLAELLNNPSMIRDVIDILSDGVFSNEQCRRLWGTIKDRFISHQALDMVTAIEFTDREFVIKYIVPASGSISFSAQSIIEHAVMLRLYAAKRVAYKNALHILQMTSVGSENYSELLAAAERLPEELKTFLNNDRKSNALADVVNELAEDIGKIQIDVQGGKCPRIPTGFKTLDLLTYSGFAPGNLIILAARPSVGKTAIMLQMAKSAASAGFVPSIFNLEMSNKELAQRMLVGTGKVTQKQIAHGEVDWAQMEDAIGEVVSNHMFLYEDRDTIEDISAQIVLNNCQGKCDIAFIDYLGLMVSSEKKSLYQEISGITKRLKRLAKDCGIPIVLLCQQNRSSEVENRPPQMSDLRDSGSIEQDADIVLMLERLKQATTAPSPSSLKETRVNMWVRKNRQGNAGDVFVKLVADETFNNFTDYGIKRPPSVR